MYDKSLTHHCSNEKKLFSNDVHNIIKTTLFLFFFQQIAFFYKQEFLMMNTLYKNNY